MGHKDLNRSGRLYETKISVNPEYIESMPYPRKLAPVKGPILKTLNNNINTNTQ